MQRAKVGKRSSAKSVSQENEDVKAQITSQWSPEVSEKMNTN